MNLRKSFLVLSLCSVGVSLIAKSPPNLVQLPMDPPGGILTAVNLGRSAPSRPLHIAVSMPFGDPAGMKRFVDSVSDPKSLQYRQFITPDEVGSRFGLPTATVNNVASYLTAQGMKITLVGKNHLTILADTTVAQAEAAFHTTIEDFKTAPSVDGRGKTVASREFFAYTTKPYVPASIAPYIVHIGGLESFTRPRPKDDSPTQIRTNYSVAPMYSAGSKGQGRTVGISSFDGFLLSNLSYEYATYSLPTPAGGVASNVTVELSANADGGAGGGYEYGEADLDIQATLGMAPLCNLIIYDGGAGDIEGVLTLEANDNSCDVITESYGWLLDIPTALACHNLHLSMSAQGITYMCASGDSGTSIGPYIYPDDDPDVLMVGGTTALLQADGTRISEPCWSDPQYGEGSGGGWWPSMDTFNVLPSYQRGNGVPTNVNYRLLPDVALNADPDTGYDVYLGNNSDSPGWNVEGGTSGASPTFAGSLADTEEKIVAGGGLPADAKGHHRLGRLMDLIYSFNGDPTVFFDVTSGSSTGVLPDGTQAVPTVGWDFTSGWGAMNFAGFASKFLTLPLVAKVSIGPAVVEGGSATAVTGTATLMAPAPPGGATVVLSSSDPSIVLPQTLVVPAGSTSVPFTAKTKSVAFTTVVNVFLVAGSRVSTSITVLPPRATALAVSPASVVGGSSTALAGTVTVAEAAPPGGLEVLIGSDTPSAALVPDIVTIPAGATTAKFPVSTLGVAKTTMVHIAAIYGGEIVSSAVTITPAVASSVTLSPATLTGGATVTGTVALSGEAPAAGATVLLTSSNTAAATVPASVLIPGGMSSATFTVTTKPVSAQTTVSIGTSLGGTKTASLTVKPNGVASVTASSSTALGGVVTPTVTATLTGPAGPAGAVLTLSTSPSTAAKFSTATVTVPAGATSVTAKLTTLAVAKNTAVVITVTSVGNMKATGTVTVLAATLSALSVSPATVVGGSTTTVTGTVTLNGPAGPGGVSVALSSSAKSAASVPSTVTVAAGATTATFKVTTFKVTANVAVTITSTAASLSKTATLTVSK